MKTLTEGDCQELIQLSQHPELVKLVFGEKPNLPLLRTELLRLELEHSSMVASRVLTSIEPVEKSWLKWDIAHGDLFGAGRKKVQDEKPTPPKQVPLFSDLPRDPNVKYSSDEDLTVARKIALRKVRNAPTPTEEEVAANREMLKNSKRPGGELRGNSVARKVRTAKLLNEFGDGEHCPCIYCGAELDSHSLSQDKIFTADQGGRYRMENLLPACLSCNKKRNDKGWNPSMVGGKMKTTTPKPTDSLGKHLQHGKYTAARKALHDKIISDHLAAHEAEDEPTATFMGGGAASGKSSLPLVKKGVVIDPDELRTHLPEYNAMIKKGDPKAAAYVHAEASELARELRAAALEKHVSYTLDGIGNVSTDRMRRVITEAKKAGYQTHGVYVTVPTAVAQERAAKRAEETGRVVPDHIIKNSHTSVSRIFPKIANEFDTSELWNTEHQSPRLVGVKGVNGSFTPTAPQLWQDFLDKAPTPPPKVAKVRKRSVMDAIEEARDEALETNEPVELPSDYT